MLPPERGNAPFVIVQGHPVYEFDAADYAIEDVITPTSRTFIHARLSDNPHLALDGTCHKCCTAGSFASSDGLVKEGHHVVGKTDRDLYGHDTDHTKLGPILGCSHMPQ